MNDIPEAVASSYENLETGWLLTYIIDNAIKQYGNFSLNSSEIWGQTFVQEVKKQVEMPCFCFVSEHVDSIPVANFLLIQTLNDNDKDIDNYPGAQMRQLN